MNLKLTNEVGRPVDLKPKKKQASSVKEERRRTGRYIAILVGICLLILAIYHAWVRRIPVVASLVVPALIMFIYVGWVLYSASRDKLKLLDAEAAMNALSQETTENDAHVSEASTNNNDITVISSKDSTKLNSPEDSVQKDWAEISSVLLKAESNVRDEDNRFITPIILVNDRPPEDFDQIWTRLVETVADDKHKYFNDRRFKRKFCRSKKAAVFKRSYSIA